MGNNISDEFIAMCRARMPDRFAQEFAVNFSRLVPQFNAKTKLTSTHFSGTVLYLDGYDQVPAIQYVLTEKSGLKALLQRTFGALMGNKRLAAKGFKMVVSPYLPSPKQRKLTVECAAYQWRTDRFSRHDLHATHPGFWMPEIDDPNMLTALVRIWYVYDPICDQLHIEFDHERLTGNGASGMTSDWQRKAYAEMRQRQRNNVLALKAIADAQNKKAD